MLFPFSVTNASSNIFGACHGGSIFAMVDVFTSMALCAALLPETPPHLSLAIDVQYYSAAKVGTKVVARTFVDRIGKTTALISIDFVEAARPDFLFASGSHRKNILFHQKMHLCGEGNA